MFYLHLFFCFAILTSILSADPQPGDVFREYMWWKTDGDAGGALRVGGREVTTLVKNIQNTGAHQVSFDAANLASGLYLYQLSFGSMVKTRKMTLLR